MKNLKKSIVDLLIVLIIFTIFCGCKGTQYTFTPLYDQECPFRTINFSTATETDSLSKTVAFNDSLVKSLTLDLEKLQTDGSVSNNLVLAINNLTTSSSTRSFEVTPEYFELYNSKTAAICGLNDILWKNKKLGNDPVNRQKALDLMLKLVEDLATFSDKKKELLNPN